MTQIARSAVFIGFDSLCRQHGLNPHALLQQCQLDPLLLRRQDLYLPYARFAQVLSLAAAQAECPSFGLLLAQAESFADVLKLTQQYVHLHAQGIALQARLDRQHLQVEYRLQLQENVDQRQLLELGLGVVHRSMQSLFGEQWQLRQLLIRHACQGQPSDYQHFFNCPVLFEQPLTALVADPATATLRPLEQRQQLKSHLLQQYAQRHQLVDDLATRIRFVLQSILSTGEASLPVVARLLDKHPRSLQQALHAQGLNFRRLLDEVRYAEARQQLRQSNQSITDLALHLGYADETAFSRAFKRWSGQAPQPWRLAARAAH